LISSSAAADCLTIAAPHAVLDMHGKSLIGPGSGATGAGIHVLSSATGAYIDGIGAVITKFGTGILIEGSDVAIFSVELIRNEQFGLVINGGARNALYDSDAGSLSDFSSGNGVAGVMINNGSNNFINDIHADHNGKYGIEVSGGANNHLHDLDGDFNGIYGLWINGSSGNRIVNSTGSHDQQIGIYIGCAPTGGLGGVCPAPATGSNNVIDFGEATSNTMNGIAVDSSDLANQIGLNSIVDNGATDAVDANANCGTNLWFLNQIGTAAPNCIH